MENSEFLWQAVTVASVVGNALQAWVRLKSQGKPQSVEIEKQPVSILKSRQAATMDNVKVLHKRINGIDGRIDRLEQTQAQDKKTSSRKSSRYETTPTNIYRASNGQ